MFGSLVNNHNSKIAKLIINNSHIMTLFQWTGKVFNHVLPIDTPQRELLYFKKESIPFHSIHILPFIRSQKNQILLLSKKFQVKRLPKTVNLRKLKLRQKLEKLLLKSFPEATFWLLQPHICSCTHILAPAAQRSSSFRFLS